MHRKKILRRINVFKKGPQMPSFVRLQESPGSNDKACASWREFCELPFKNYLAIRNAITKNN